MASVFQFDVEQYLKQNKSYFENFQIKDVKSLIENSNKSMEEIRAFKLKSPSTATVLAVFFGWLGIDRFYNGNYLYGCIKLFTAGVFFVGWFIDILLIRKSVRVKNYERFFAFIKGVKVSTDEKHAMDTIKQLLQNEDVRSSLKELRKAHKRTMDTFDPSNNY